MNSLNQEFQRLTAKSSTTVLMIGLESGSTIVKNVLAPAQRGEMAERLSQMSDDPSDEPEAADNTIRINKTMTPDEEVMAIIDKIENEDANAASAADDKMKALPL